MRPRGLRPWLFLIGLAACGCASAARSVRSYPAPTADDLLGVLKSRQENLRGINAEARVTAEENNRTTLSLSRPVIVAYRTRPLYAVTKP